MNRILTACSGYSYHKGLILTDKKPTSYNLQGEYSLRTVLHENLSDLIPPGRIILNIIGTFSSC